MEIHGWSEFSHIQDKINQLFKENWKSSTSTLKTRNITDYDRDLLFVWNPKDNNILVINFTLVAGLQTNGANYHQTLQLKCVPDWNVDRLIVNETGTHLLLLGARGACIVVLPARWGSSGLFINGRQSILCQSYPVYTTLFNSSQSLQVRDARWCPTPLPEQLFVILTSDNILRLYRSSKVKSPLQEWRVGRPLGTGSLMNPGTSMPLLAALGDVAVSFDFLPGMLSNALDAGVKELREPEVSFMGTKPSGTSTPMPKQSSKPSKRLLKKEMRGGSEEKNETDVIWPIAVLFGHGDVYIVVPPNLHPTKCSSERVKLFGPLRMFPATGDNYGAESCSLMCLQTQPPLLVLASASGGALYHALLLEKHEEVETDLASLSSYTADCDLEISECSKALYVTEKIILELGLMSQESTPSEDFVYSCPISLIRDPASPSRYFCSHDGGAHVVTLPLVPSLMNLTAGKCDVQEVMISSSQVSYLLSTRLSTQDTTSKQHYSQGLILQPTMNLGLSLLSSGQAALLPLPLSPIPSLQLPAKPELSTQKSEDEGDFSQQIRCLLSRSTSQPLIMLPPGAKPSNRESLDILNKTTQTLRKEYIAKHATVTETFKRKIAMQRKMLQDRKQSLAQLDTEIADAAMNMQASSQILEDKKENLAGILTRLQTVHVKLSLAQPTTSDAENQMKNTMEQIQPKVGRYQETMFSLKSSINSLKAKKDDAGESDGGSEATLSDQQVDVLTGALKEIGDKIQKLKSSLVPLKSACKDAMPNVSSTTNQ